jgi:hypothetical protein
MKLLTVILLVLSGCSSAPKQEIIPFEPYETYQDMQPHMVPAYPDCDKKVKKECMVDSCNFIDSEGKIKFTCI